MNLPLKLNASIVGVLALTLAAGAAFGQPPAGGGGGGGRGGAVRQACAADIQKFCPNIQPGPGGGMRDCIRKNFDGLSDSCKSALQQMRAMRQQQQQQGGGAAAPQQ
jgi:hypothetical protein